MQTCLKSPASSLVHQALFAIIAPLPSAMHSHKPCFPWFGSLEDSFANLQVILEFHCWSPKKAPILSQGWQLHTFDFKTCQKIRIICYMYACFHLVHLLSFFLIFTMHLHHLCYKIQLHRHRLPGGCAWRIRRPSVLRPLGTMFSSMATFLPHPLKLINDSWYYPLVI